MERISTLKSLLVEQLRQLYNAEKQQAYLLTKLQDEVTYRELRVAIQMHIDATNDHISRLENTFQQLSITSYGQPSESMQALIKSTYLLTDRCSDPEVRDAAIIAALQYIEHFEMAGYGTACAFANELGQTTIAEVLHRTLKEEDDFDERLSDMAKEMVNRRAKMALAV